MFEELDSESEGLGNERISSVARCWVGSFDLQTISNMKDRHWLRLGQCLAERHNLSDIETASFNDSATPDSRSKSAALISRHMSYCFTY
jgi:hypothetical protein